jgi:hypothetical protein
MSERSWDQSAWRLAKTNAIGVYTSAPFNLATGMASVVVAASVALLSYGDKPLKVGLLAVAAGLGLYLLCYASVLAFQLAVAPIRQRDELRHLMHSGEQPSPAEVAAQVSDLARRGEDLLQGGRSGGGLTAHQRDEVEQWTSEVARFLSRHCAGAAPIEFSQASRGTAPLLGKLEDRLEILDRLVESLMGQGSPALP